MAATTTLKLPESLKEQAIQTHAELAEQRKAFQEEARARLAEFDRTRTAYRAADVHRYLRALAGNRRAKKPKLVKV